MSHKEPGRLLGLHHVQLAMPPDEEQAAIDFYEGVLGLDQVQECHHITGEFSLLLKVRVADMGALQKLLIDQLNAYEGVRQTRTVMALSTLKEESFIPTAARGETA